MRALISVFDKTGLDTLAKGLASLGWELVASGGTADSIRELGLDVTKVEELTEFPEMLGGRVKTLHPRIHAGILARREVETDLAALAEQGIELFDLVCVNLYPFEQVAREHGVREEEAVEMIDIGGPSMLRGAAKNFAHVAPVCRHERLRARARRSCARPASSRTRRAGGWRRRRSRRRRPTRRRSRPGSPAARRSRPIFTPVFEKHLDLAYGENPHQSAAYYAERGVRTHLLARVEQLHGRELSFNNLNDLNAARLLVREFALPACVIVKHANPCGVAVGASIEEAYEIALAADPLSAYGGVVVLNRAVSAALGERLAEQFVEVLFAPGYDEVALEALVQKQSIRILNDTERRQVEAWERDYKRVLGGLLVQDRDWDVEDREGMEIATGEPTEAQWGDLLFAARVCKHVASNAIVIAKDLQTIGIGAGQMSRVDAVRIAIEKAHEHGHSLDGRLARLGCVLPLPRRSAAGARRGRQRLHPARRLETRPRRDRGGRERRRGDGVHRAPALPPLIRGRARPADPEPRLLDLRRRRSSADDGRDRRRDSGSPRARSRPPTGASTTPTRSSSTPARTRSGC